MLLDCRDFPFTTTLERAFDVIRAESATLRRDEYLLWPDSAAYQGEWLAFPLFLQSGPKSYLPHLPHNRARVPQTVRVLESIPRLVSAAFSRLEPLCHIYRHTDVKPPNVLRAHLALSIPAEACMRVGTDMHGWREGECVVFDGSVLHETANLSLHTPRVVLLVDVVLDDAEFRALRAAQQRHANHRIAT